MSPTVALSVGFKITELFTVMLLMLMLPDEILATDTFPPAPTVARLTLPKPAVIASVSPALAELMLPATVMSAPPDRLELSKSAPALFRVTFPE